MLTRRWSAVAIVMMIVSLAAPALDLPVAMAGEYERGDDVKEDPRSVPVKTLDEAIRSGRIPKESVAAAQKEGMAAVLVKLKLPEPFRPEGELDEKQVETQRRAIAKAQGAVLERISSMKNDDPKTYETIPWMALQADVETLTELVRHAGVFRITVDGVEDYQLGTSVPQINGDIVRRSLGTPGAGQTIAIIDSGVNGTHPFLAGKVVSEGCFSTEQPLRSGNVCPGGSDSTAAGSGVPCNLVGCAHGTQVAGIAVANDTTLFGVAPAANIIAIQVSSDFGGTPRPKVSDQLEGLERVYALRNTFDIAAVNMSISGGEFYTSQSKCDDDHESRKDVIDNLRAAGIATVAASGNNGDDDSPIRLGIAAPACISSVISVGATMGIGTSETPANWMPGASQTAPFLDLLAPGTNINTTIPGTFVTGLLSGTSAAAPHVSGAVAVLAAQKPLASVTDILNALTSTGIPIIDTRPSPAITTPRILLDFAVEALTGTPLPPSGLQVDTDLGTWLTVSWTDNSRSEAEFIVTATPPLSSLLPPRHGTAGAGGTSAVVGGETAADGTVLKLRPDTDYSLTVQACNAAGNCAESPPVSHHTLDTLPEEPDNLHLSNHTTSGVTLNWNTSYPATFVRLVRYVCDLGYDCDPTTPYIELHGDESFDMTGLIGNWEVRWRIQACSLDGCSAWVDGPSAANPVQGTPPAAPTDLRLCGTSGAPFEACLANRITLGWDDNANNEESYEFEWTIAQQGTPPWNASWNTVSLGPNRTGYSLTSWSSGLLYFFRVRACNVYGCSLYSNMVSLAAP